MDACTECVSGSRGLQDHRAATLTAMLAVSFDGQHVVKRFYILPAFALVYWLTH
jgi:hypothetical protein